MVMVVLCVSVWVDGEQEETTMRVSPNLQARSSLPSFRSKE
jgi:hypothetical protein